MHYVVTDCPLCTPVEAPLSGGAQVHLRGRRGEGSGNVERVAEYARLTCVRCPSKATDSNWQCRTLCEE